MRCLSLFTGLKSEEHFYLTSARIELVSARALSHMQRTLDELFLSDAIAVRRITDHLTGLARNIDEMTVVLNTMYDGCDPTEFYRDIRPWFRGGEAWPGGAGWEFEGVENPEERERARFTNGASAGQSSIVHALDIFLGTPNTHSAYLHKMEYHMPRHHRAFLRHLRTLPPHLKLADLLQSSLATDAVKNAFNDAVMALKRFRDSHIRIAAVYIISQARRAGEGIVSHATPVPKHSSGDGNEPTTGVKGTGGTDLVPFLKNLRDNTARTLIPVGEGEESGR
jgi:indoleamine 2,3-dioxygenase